MNVIRVLLALAALGMVAAAAAAALGWLLLDIARTATP